MRELPHINSSISERKSAFKVSGNIKSLRRNPNPSFCPFPLYQGVYIYAEEKFHVNYLCLKVRSGERGCERLFGELFHS